MQPHEARDLAGWGRYPVQRCHVARPEKRATVQRLLDAGDQPSYIARGLGRSYGDAALNEDAGVVDDTRLDRLLAFDPDTGRVRVEAGVPLADLIDVFLPRGFFLPVTPGTKHVTVGGALAANVHGKNHHVDGAIAEHVERFTLATPAEGIVACSRDENPELFWATLGGMGLTGVILTATLGLIPVESAYVVLDRDRTGDLDATLDAFDEDEAYRYSVAWLDTLATGDAMGRGVVMRGDHAPRDVAEAVTDDPLAVPERSRLSVPVTLPSWLLNGATARAFNAAYHRANGPVDDEPVDLEAFFYPLDRVEAWNRAYGRDGFLQHQSVVPLDGGREAVRELVEAVVDSRLGSFLAVLKRMGPGDEGPLSFPMEGYTLALDLPRTTGVDALCDELDRITVRHGGRVYLAKDAMLDRATFDAMYSQAERFTKVKRRVDPDDRLSSSLARRVGLVQEASP